MKPRFDDTFQAYLRPPAAEMVRLEQAGEGIYAGCCRDAKEAECSAEAFYYRLVAGGLVKPRASELKTILSDEAVARDFIAGEIGRKAAVKKVRAAMRPQPVTEEEQLRQKVQRAAKRVLQLMRQAGLEQCKVPGGLLRIAPIAPPLPE